MQTLYRFNPVAAPEPEINTTPLIDVMLVLLVMLLITIPAATQSINIELPSRPTLNPQPRPVVNVEIDFDGVILWNGEVVADWQRLESLCRQSALLTSQPDIRVRAHRLAKYDSVAQVMAIAQRNALRYMGLVGNEAL